MQMDRHHLLEIILWPNSDGTFRKILNSRARLIELGIYDDWKLTITIPASEHSKMHSHNRPDGYWDKVSQSISAALKGNTPWNKGKTGIYSADTIRKMSKAQIGEKHYLYRKKHSAATKAKMSAAHKGNTNVRGTRWFNNGITSIRAKECPDDFVPGMLRKI